MTYKKITSYLIITISLSLMGSCSTSTSKTDTEPVDIPTVTFELNPIDNILSRSFSKIKFLQLKKNNDCTIGDIKKIVDGNGKLIVLTNDKEILVYNKEDGKFLHQIGTTGESQNEDLTATDIYYDDKNNSINVFDSPQKTIFSYSTEGKFLKKREFEAPINLADCVASTTDGYLMFSNQLSDEVPASDYAYTLIYPDGNYSCFDPFAPVYVEEQTVGFANRPLTPNGDKISFFKLFSDTIFSMEKGNLTPLYKLSLEKPMPDKERVAQNGSLQSFTATGAFSSSQYFVGFNNIFETQRYIAIIPKHYENNGFLWIDKTTGKGFTVPSSWQLKHDIFRIITGYSIEYLVGSNEKELISSFPAHIGKGMFSQEFAEHPEIKPFSPDLKPFWESVDPDGNPCLIIYEH